MVNYRECIGIADRLLSQEKVPHLLIETHRPDGWKIQFLFWSEGDIAINQMTCGNEIGLVETYRFPWDEEDVTILLPEEAARRVIALYKERQVF